MRMLRQEGAGEVSADRIDSDTAGSACIEHKPGKNAGVSVPLQMRRRRAVQQMDATTLRARVRGTREVLLRAFHLNIKFNAGDDLITRRVFARADIMVIRMKWGCSMI
jgi:hypothetical protein